MNYKKYKHKIFGGDIKSIEITLKPYQKLETDGLNLIYKDKGITTSVDGGKQVTYINSSQIPQVVTFLYELD